MKILAILTQSKKSVEKNKALRKAKALYRKQGTLMDKLEEKRDEQISKREQLLSITLENVNEDTWNEEYQACQVEMKMLDAQIQIAKETYDELFSEEEA